MIVTTTLGGRGILPAGRRTHVPRTTSKSRDSPMHEEQEADCLGRSTSWPDKNSPNMNSFGEKERLSKRI